MLRAPAATTTNRTSCACSHHRPQPRRRQQHCHAIGQELLDAASTAGPSGASVSGTAEDTLATVATSAQIQAEAMSHYVPGPVEVGWQIWFAAVISTIPFVIGAYEFGKRILIQRRCNVCGGNGLVQKGRYLRKCPECGGFFPWISWGMFLSANARPGNGGPLLQPRGQTSVFYTVPPAEPQQGAVDPTNVSSAGIKAAAPGGDVRVAADNAQEHDQVVGARSEGSSSRNSG